MAGSSARRARRDATARLDDDDQLDDDGLDAAVADEEPARRSRLGGTAVAKAVGNFFNQQGGEGESGSSLRMQDREPSIGYAAAIVLVIVPIIFLTSTGKINGHDPSRIAPAIAVVLALAMAGSIRLSNRIVTATLAVGSALAATSSTVPSSIRYLSSIDLVAALGFAVWISLRQSKMRSAQAAERRAALRSARGGTTPTRQARGGRRGKPAEEPKGPPPSRRYTPPKNRSAK